MKTLSIVSTLLVFAFFSQSFSDKPGEELAAAAQQFLNSLDKNQRAQATFAMDNEERYNWNFVPKERKGMPLKSMNEVQRKAAHRLIQASLSQQGYKKATQIMELENVLRSLEGRGADDTYRDPLNYYLSIFGKPQLEEAWGWRLEGHHLSLNFSSVDNRIVSASPAFFGSNPAKVPSGPKKGWQVLQPEEDLARTLMRSLSPSQLQTALLAEEAYPEIVTGTEQEAKVDNPEGIAFPDMTKEQQNKLMQLLQVYYEVYKPELAKKEMQEIKEDQDQIYFGWAGSLESGQGHYYRIQGPAFVIEYDNTQNNANHVHTVIRDLENDFGGNILKEHYEEAHKE